MTLDFSLLSGEKKCTNSGSFRYSSLVRRMVKKYRQVAVRKNIGEQILDSNICRLILESVNNKQ